MKNNNDAYRFVLVLGGYFVLQLLVRVAVSPGLELDEAEQLLLSQHFQWGYGSQPPLYTWLQSGLFALCGVSVFSLALLKNLLLATTYVCTYLTARNLGYDRYISVSAALSLFLFPQIAWESQRDLTHSVLATTMAAATLAAWTHVRLKPTWYSYLVNGLCWGLGLLAKYNYGIFLVSLLGASVTVGRYRHVLMNRKMFGALLVTAATISPHALWAYNNIPLLLSSSHKFKISAANSYVLSVMQGIGSLATAVCSFTILCLIVYGILYFRYRNITNSANDCTEQVSPDTLLVRSIVVSLGIAVLLVVVFRTTAFKDRWMQQMLFYLPVAMLPWTERVFRCGGGRVIRLLALGIGCLVITGLALRARITPYFHMTTRFNLPYVEIAERLLPQIASVDLVVADSSLLGGTIRKISPCTPVLVPTMPRTFDVVHPKRLLAVWHKDSKSDGPQQAFAVVRRLTGPATPEQVGNLVEPYRYAQDKTVSISYAVFSPSP